MIGLRNLMMGTSSVKAPTLYTLFGANIGFYFDPAYLQTLWQESPLDGASPVGETPVAATNDRVGTLYDIGNMAMLLAAANNARRPKLTSIVGSDAWLRFTSANKEFLYLLNSKQYLANICKANPVFTLAFEIDCSTLVDGTQYILFDNTGGTTAKAGFYIVRNAANQLLFAVYKAVGGQNVVQITTAGTLTAASGVRKVRLEVNGVGANKASVFIDNAAAETGTVNAGVDGLVLTNDLQIGCHIDTNTNAFNGSLRKIILTWHAWSAGEVTGWKAADPQRDATTSIYRTYREIDTNYLASLFKTSSLVPVAANNDPVRVIKIKNPVTNGGDLCRNWIATEFYVDITGSSGSCKITIDGVDYVVNFTGGSLFNTSVNFVQNNAAALLTANWYAEYQQNSGVPGQVLGRVNFTRTKLGLALSVVSVTNLSGTLNGTIGDTERPVYKTNQINGEPALEFSWPAASNFNMQDSLANPNELGGAYARFFAVYYNIGTSAGDNGHFAIGGDNSTSLRWLVTAPGYTGDLIDFPNGHYTVVHASGDSFGDALVKPQAWNLISYRRVGRSVRWYVNGALVGTKTLVSQARTRIVKRGQAQDGVSTTDVLNQWQGQMAPTLEIQGTVPLSIVDSLNAQLMARLALTP